MPTFAFLVPIDPGLCVIPLEKAVVLIGRQADCDISLTQSRKVSRRHCCLAQVNHQIMARDLGSTNGIYLNGERVKRQCRLSVGDEFMIGDLKFRLQLDPNPQPVVPPRAEKPKLPPENQMLSISSQPTPFIRGVPGGELPSMEVPVILPEVGRDFAVDLAAPRLPLPGVPRNGAQGDVRMPITPPIEVPAPARNIRPGDSGPIVPIFPDELNRNHVPPESRGAKR